MSDQKRSEMVATCGIDCGVCELYTCAYNADLMDFLVSKGIPKEKLPCSGCRPSHGACPVNRGDCETFMCASKNDVDYCCNCNDFPCNKLQPAADRAETLPHNIKVFNLCTIKNFGIDEFIKRSQTIKARYYKGKMAIGQGPQL